MVVYDRVLDSDIHEPGSLYWNSFDAEQRGILTIRLDNPINLNRCYDENEVGGVMYYSFENPAIKVIKTFRGALFLECTFDDYSEATGEVLGRIAEYYPIKDVRTIKVDIL